jgi:predicted peptidase
MLMASSRPMAQSSKGATVTFSKLICSLAAMALVASVPAFAGDKVETGFLNKIFKGKDSESKYVVFVPHGYQGDKEYPLILFLHGAGERGDDGELPVKQGIGNAIKFKGGAQKFPFFAIFPQCAKGGGWKAGGPDADRALAILEQVQKQYKIDSKRIYLTGLSLGGTGTWSLAAAHPDRWAAIVPICGAGDPATAAKIKDIPCWCFVGDGDNPGLVKKNREMIDTLKKAGGVPRYTEFPYVGHNSWDPAYVTSELYPWLLAHPRK